MQLGAGELSRRAWLAGHGGECQCSPASSSGAGPRWCPEGSSPHHPVKFIHLCFSSTEGTVKELLAERVAFKVEEGERENKKRVHFARSIPHAYIAGLPDPGTSPLELLMVACAGF